MTNSHSFARYDLARERYQESQDDMARFLARFAADSPSDDEQFTFRDLAYLVGLRTERDIAFAEFYKHEAEIFRFLSGQILPETK